ncbi:MAG: type II toxin-antitoxin system Phd/YefM family antitoxin [Gemmatimonadetes bacterium]|nr:type II toxin-antitoxin system Phd/YefM family antitoxin [Gemmatimonadota bacterium]
MLQVNMHEAKTNLSKLIRRVLSGEEVLIARSGTPVARLGPVEPQRKGPRIPGSARGLVHMKDDFDAPLPEDLLTGFEGGPEQ